MEIVTKLEEALLGALVPTLCVGILSPTLCVVLGITQLIQRNNWQGINGPMNGNLQHIWLNSGRRTLATKEPVL